MTGSLRGCLVIALLFPLVSNGGVTKTEAPAQRDGQHDFDFEIGSWETHLKRLLHPLTGSTSWIDYAGTTVVRKVWNGRANLVELEVGGPQGRIQGLSLRLYNPDAHQWSLNFSNSAGGTLSPPFAATTTEIRHSMIPKLLDRLLQSGSPFARS